MKEQACRALYREAFRDPDTAFEDALFLHCFRYVKTAEEAGEVVSMLFALPCVIETEDQKTDAVYLYAAATKKSERGKGYMRRLLESVKREYDTAFLVPASKELISFYRKSGFCEFRAATYRTGGAAAIPTGGFADLVGGYRETKQERFPAMIFSETPLNVEGMYFPYRME